MNDMKMLTLWCEKSADVMIKRKRVIVTGASSGIGKELTLLLCRMGANVFITARRKQLLQQVQRHYFNIYTHIFCIILYLYSSDS